MRWKNIQQPKIRVRTHFALFPTRMSDGMVVWLECYSRQDEYLFVLDRYCWVRMKKWAD